MKNAAWTERRGIRGQVLLGVSGLLLPLGVLFYFNMQQTGADISFADKEMLGNRVQRPLVALLASPAEANLTSELGQLREAVASAGEALGLDAGLAEQLENLHRQRAAGGAAAEARWREALRGAITKAGDASNLTLDPEMDSYYLADASSVVVAQAIGRVLEIGALLRAGNTADLAIQVAVLRQFDMARMKSDIETALAENAKAERGASPTLKAGVEARLAEYLEAAERFAAAAQTERSNAGWEAAERRVRLALVQLQAALVGELDAILRMRIENYEWFRIQVVSGTLVALGISLLLLFRTLNRISKPLAVVTGQLSALAEKDLSREVPDDYLLRGDEIGTLARASRDLTASMRGVITAIAASVGSIDASSQQLKASATEMTSGVEDTAQRAQSTSVAAEEISANVGSIAASMEQTSTNLEHVAQSAGEMSKSIANIALRSEEARRTTSEASEQAEQVRLEMRELAEAAVKIGEVTGTIKEISAQTNLLALNASIEAARAGAAGKGFAVVANEIKDLAQQTARATDDIRERIESLQSSTGRGTTEIARIFDAIQGIRERVETIAGAMEAQAEVTASISGHLREAAIGTQEANLRVAESSTVSLDMAKDAAAVHRVAKLVAGESETVAKQAEGLRGTAHELAAIVETFTLSRR